MVINSTNAVEVKIHAVFAAFNSSATAVDESSVAMVIAAIRWGVNKRKDMTSSFLKDQLRQYINQLKKQCTRKIYKRSSILGLRTTLVLKRCGLVRAAPT